MTSKPETALIKSGIELLTRIGAKAIRTNAGMIPLESNKGHKRMIRMCPPGTTDITACMPDGRFGAFEGKLGKNKASTLQLCYIDDIRKRGGVAGVFWSLDDLIEIVRNEGYRI